MHIKVTWLERKWNGGCGRADDTSHLYREGAQLNSLEK